MPDEKEVQPLPAAEKGVSSQPAPSELLRSAQKKKAKDRTPEETKAIRAYQKATKEKSRRKQRNDVDSDTEIKAKEAEEILRADRNIRNPRVVEVCIELARVASRNLKVPFNRSLFTKGVQGTLAAMNGMEPPAFPADEWHAGERVREHELWAVWDYSISWRIQPDGTKLSFEQWKDYRRRCITDVVWFGNFVLGKDFQPEPHGRWAEELFPQLEPALMMLPEKFGQKDIAKAFYALSDVRQRCLISARSSYKSTWSTVWTLALMLCFAGSLRILVCTATQPLAKGFAKSFRSYLTVKDPNNPTLLNQLFPEHCIAPDEGKTLEYTSPFRQLDVLIEPTLSATSVISEGQAGGRYDLGVMDDCAEISNSNTPENRAKTQERIDMLRELGEPHSLTNFVGTPISAGAGTDDDPGDLYSVLLRREEKNLKEGGEPKLLYTICPAWTVNSWVYNKTPWDPTLKEDEVTLLFPARLSFKYLMAKLRESLATDKTAKIFRQQSLVSWVPDEESQLTVTFTEEALRSKLRPRSFFDATAFPGTPVYLATDVAWSVARTADFSANAIVRVQSIAESKENALVVLDVAFGRWKESEKIINICRLIELHKPSAWVLEKDRGHEELVLGVRKMCNLKGLAMPHVILRDIKNGPQAKALKIKILENPLVDGRLWFASGHWNDACFQQFIRFDGIKRSGQTDGSKDDIPDAIATAYQVWGPRAISETVDPEDRERRERELEEEALAERRRQQYAAMFSAPYTPPPPVQENPQPQAPADPRAKVFSYGRFVQPSSDRGKLFGVKGPYKQ